jgi:hypothetical protein
MKLKEIDKLISALDEDNIEKEYCSPCWEAMIDVEKQRLVMLIDREEIASSPLTNFKDLSLQKLSYFISILRNGKIEELKKELFIG